MEIILTICSVFWISFGLMMKTKNFASTFIFKLLPFFTGLASLLCAMDLFGWMNIFA